MIRVVIVDDEEKIRLGLARLIERAGEEFRVTGVCAGGAELLAQLPALEADLVITDIKMPHVNGLELIERIRAARPELPLAVLSGFDDFAYARTALRHGVLEYLLKPVDEGELRGLLQRVKALVEERRNRQLESLERYLALAANGEADRMPDPWRGTMLKELEDHELFAGNAAVLLMLAPTTPPEPAAPEAGPLPLQAPRPGGPPKERLASLLSGVARAACLAELPWGAAAVVSLGEDDQAAALRELAQTLPARVAANERVRLGFSGAFRGAGGLAGACAEASAALQQAWYAPGRAVGAGPGRVKPAAETAAHPFFLLDRDFWPAVDALDVPRAVGALRAWTAEVARQAVPWPTLAAGCEAVYALLRGETPCGPDGEAPEEAPDWDPRRFPDWASYAERFLRLAEEALGRRRTARRESRVVEKIKAYIREHYQTDIELSRLAEEVFLSPSYLSKLFRTETGETITDFIISCRIARAKELLDEENGLKTYEIGEMVGYPDPAYFNKVFKKVVGMTPREYRDRAR